VKECRAFLGLPGYHRKCIPNCADIAKPMTKCLKMGATIDAQNLKYIESFKKTYRFNNKTTYNPISKK